MSGRQAVKNPKHQMPNPKEGPNLKAQTRHRFLWKLEFMISPEFGSWDLGLLTSAPPRSLTDLAFSKTPAFARNRKSRRSIRCKEKTGLAKRGRTPGC